VRNRGAVPVEVVAEQLDQDRRDGGGPGFVLGTVLEAAGLAGGAVVGQILAVPGRRCQHVHVDQAENKALVRRYYDEVLTGGDRKLLARLLDPGFVSHISGGPDAGAEAYAAAVAVTHAAFPDLVITVHDQVAEDDKVVTRWSATGTHAGDFAGVPATGRVITVSGIHIHRIRHGRLIEHWEELNLLGVLRQLGVMS
jgi:steroid delta-isomerase-like uncharacterized protein